MYDPKELDSIERLNENYVNFKQKLIKRYPSKNRILDAKT